MVNLKQKIQYTNLFTSEEKVEILAAIDTFSQKDLDKLAHIVDEYDGKFAEILSTFRQNMLSELNQIEKSVAPDRAKVMHEAVEQVKLGIAAITSQPTQAS